ncbi:MAG: hypothetical protein WC091_02060 [Sulfuricellaceae bacterium]
MEDMNTAPKKPGRPVTGTEAMTPAERQRASRRKRKAQRFESFQAQQVSVILSAEASQALTMLCHNRDLSQKALLDQLLIAAYRTEKNALPG